jgi:hypothetical protein
MPEIKTLNQLEKYLNDYINNALNKDVAEIAKENMQLHIQRDVYKPYTPYAIGGGTNHYQRTGKLLQDVETTMEGNTLILEDTRNDEADVNNNRDLIKVIEEGKGYEWGYKRNLDEEIGARPFIENTFEDLSKGLASEALKKGLKRQGLNVE